MTGSDDSTRDVSQVIGSDAPLPAALPMPLVVAELTASLRQRRDEPWSLTRNALREEWRQTMAAVGPRLRQALDGPLSDVDARLAAATDRASRDATADVLDTIRAAALTPDCLRAAWHDVVTAAGDDNISARRAVTARAQLKGLLVAAGRDADDIERRRRGRGR